MNRVSDTIMTALAFGHQSRTWQQLAETADAQTRAIIGLSAAYDLKPSVARKRFQEVCERSPWAWDECYRMLLAGEKGAASEFMRTGEWNRTNNTSEGE